VSEPVIAGLSHVFGRKEVRWIGIKWSSSICY
jgi:hypothetical protein